MTAIRTAELVAAAAERVSAVFAFNVITLEHAEAIAAAAERTDTAVIAQLSENAVRYHGRLEPIGSATAAVVEAAAVPIALHLDHVTDEALLALAGAPFTSVMIDASALPYEENVARTKAAAEQAHAHGLWVEAELGSIGGKPGTAHAPGARTDPAEAAAFVAATGVDGLAVAVGSQHAMTAQTATLDHELIAALAAAVPVPLVLHGSSGVPVDELRRAVAAGIRKVNVGTALNVALTTAVRRTLADDADLVDPRRYLAAGRTAMTDAVAELLQAIA